MSASHSPNTFFPVGNTNVTYTVVDNAGNTSTCSFAINVVDAELPVIICPDTIASCNPNVAFELPTATDNCDVDTIIQLAGLPSGSVFPVGLTVNVFEVTDVHGNSSTCSFTVRIYPLPVASNTVEDVSCFGFGDGSVDLTLTNGAAPYQTNWSNGQTTEDISGLTPGTYTVGVIDNNGCTTTDTAVITQPTALTLEGLVDNVSCYNLQNGSIQITVDGGTLPYTYNWQSGQTSEDLNGLDTGSYVLNVTDANGCEIDFSTTITQPDTLTIQAVVYGATCNAANGSIQTLVTGGTTPYVYNWSNGGSNQNLNNVPAGIYTLDVLDAQGCQVSYTGEVLPEINLTASILAKDVSCYGGSNGELTAIVSNGNEPYTYSWSNGETTAHVEGLTAGNYDLLITDVFGCTANLTAVINQPDTLTIDISLSSYLEGYNVSSNGGTDGYISTSVAGGVAPYTYYWSNGDTTAFVDQLSAGEYLVVVTDHNNCVSAISVVLTQPDVLEMPQGFSPNADGENDFFVVHGIKSYPENTITVFNRWGNIVYQKDGYADEWYGENNSGEALPDATYFVILKAMVAGKEVVLQGYVDLRRK
jgi:gliding motility-associated-like protein